jgi:hypothetical protein
MTDNAPPSTDTQPEPPPKPKASCLGLGLMIVMVVGMIAWTVLVVAGYFHHGK